MADVTIEGVLAALEDFENQKPIVFCSPAMAEKLEEHKGELPPHRVEVSKFVSERQALVWRPNTRIDFE